MAKDYSTSVRTTEVYPDNASGHPITGQYVSHNTEPGLSKRWPAEPHTLIPEPSEERWLKAYDITLCLIPLALIAKAVLCIVAYEYKYQISGSSHKVQMAYFSSEKPSLFYSNESIPPANIISLINSIYNIFSRVPLEQGGSLNSAGSDLNGAARVPLLRADGVILNGDISSPIHLKRECHGWYDVSKASKMTYATFFGTPFYTIDPRDNYTIPNGLDGYYSSNATYLNATCIESEALSANVYPNGTLYKYPDNAIYKNQYLGYPSQFAISVPEAVAISSLQLDDPPRDFDVWRRFNATSHVGHASCHVHGIQVEMQVACSAGSCGAQKIRFVPGAPPINRTAFDRSNFTSVFFQNLLLANGPPISFFSSSRSISGSSVADNLADGLEVILGDTAIDDVLALAEARQYDDPILSLVMTQMINTYYQISLDPSSGSPNDDNYASDELNGVIRRTTQSNDWSTGTIRGSRYNPKYVLSIPWVIVDLMSCTILLAAAILALWLRQHTFAPDIFGYVSSLTRDNPHLNIPDSGSTMSGLERARMLKNVRVRIGDVANDSGVGKVGLRYAGLSDVQMAHLKTDRHYL